MCRILILADIRPMGYKLSCCGLGKNLLFKSILGRCEGSLQGLKIRGAYSTVVGIMCLPVEIGLTDLPKTGRGAQTHTRLRQP